MCSDCFVAGMLRDPQAQAGRALVRWAGRGEKGLFHGCVLSPGKAPAQPPSERDRSFGHAVLVSSVSQRA